MNMTTVRIIGMNGRKKKRRRNDDKDDDKDA